MTNLELQKAANIFTYLPKDPKKAGRDRFVLSKGHLARRCPMLVIEYATHCVVNVLRLFTRLGSKMCSGSQVRQQLCWKNAGLMQKACMDRPRSF